MSRRPNAIVLTTVMCLAQVGTLIDVFSFATLIKVFEAEWMLTKAQQGWISGIYFAGYVLAVPVLMAITDRVDARRVYMAGALIITAGATGFALLAEGFWSALALRAICGFGLASVYMPGLRVLVDRYSGANESRAIAFYTASWSLGAANSFLLTGLIEEAFGWHMAFYAGAGGAFFAFCLVALFLRPVPPQKPEHTTRLLDFRPVFRNRAVVGFIVSYAAHTWELLCYRAWLVAFLAFSLTQQDDPAVGWLAEPARIAMFTALTAMVASVIGNELANRFNRVRVITIVQCLSGIIACTVGFLGALPYALVVGLVMIHSFLIQSDSAPLTSGVVSVADQGRRGATLAMYNFIGWAGGFMGPVLVGIVLGAFGQESVTGWGAGFIVMGGVAFIGAATLRFCAGEYRQEP